MTKDEEIALLKKELKSVKQEYQQFAYIVSHDLNAPLRHIDYFTNRIFKKNADKLNAEAIEDKKIIINAVHEAKCLLEVLLEYSRINTRYCALENIDLFDVIEQILLRFDADIEDKKAIINLEKTTFSVKGNKKLLSELFYSLIENALKYSKEDTPPIISISFSVDSNRLNILIKDNGIGIKQKSHESVFTLFNRAVDVKLYEGKGVGLAFAKRIAGLHGGDISIKESDENGTSMLITLPALT